MKFITNVLVLIFLAGESFANDKGKIPFPDFLEDVSLWHSEVNLHDDYSKFEGKYIDGVVIGNGSMLAVEGMTTGITRLNKSRLIDSRLYGSPGFENSSNGYIEHLSRSPQLPLHYMQWVAGPVYTEYPTAYGFYYTMDYTLHGRNKSIQMNGWNHEKQYRIRNTNIVKNVLQTEDVLTLSVDFMLPDHPVLVRSITVTNSGEQVIDNCKFNVTYYIDPREWTGKLDSFSQQNASKPIANELDFYAGNVHRSPEIGGKIIKNSVLIDSKFENFGRSNQHKNKKFMLVYSPESFASVDKQFIQFNLGNLAKGESRTFCFYVITALNEFGILKNLDDINSRTVLKHLEDTYHFWKNKISEADKFALPLRKDISQYEKDYIDNVRLFLLSCNTKTGGSIAHPYSYNSVYFRDVYDTYRVMLELGHSEECKNTLLFLKEAMNRLGIKMSYSPTEFYLSGPTDSSKIGKVYTFGHFAKSEFMLFFPLMVRDYCNHFSNDEFAKAFYPEMLAALKSQPVDGEGLIAYSGDEISFKRGQPLYKYSSQNAALYVAGADFLVKIADALGDNQNAKKFKLETGKINKAMVKYFWDEKGYYVYSVDETGKRDNRLNVFSQTLPFFYGYLKPNDKKLSIMVDNILQQNTFPSFRVSTLPIEGKKVCENNGNTIGLLLYMMSLEKHSDSGRVFERMMGDAGTMGTTGEYLSVSNDGISRGELLRPYESSFNLAAALEYLKEK